MTTSQNRREIEFQINDLKHIAKCAEGVGNLILQDKLEAICDNIQYGLDELCSEYHKKLDKISLGHLNQSYNIIGKAIADELDKTN